MHEFANLVGLVLAGGKSTRMGTDKALLVYGGEPQLRRAIRLLRGFCARVLVSVRADQAREPAYAGCELVVDAPDEVGPAAGLCAAWRAAPGAALLVVAVDLPRVDAALLRLLLDARDARVIATAFAHADGTLEPLCAIWEPGALPKLHADARNTSVSVRKVLEEAQIRGLRPRRDPARLESVNTPEDYARFRSCLDL